MEQLLKQIRLGEGKSTEFKISFQKELIESIVAFANAKGGKVLIGVSDNAEVIGIELQAETIQNYLKQIKQATSPAVIPDIDAYEIDGKTILVIGVAEYPIKPVAYKGKYFKRVKNSNHQMSTSEISNMYFKVLNLSWDAYEYPKETIDSLDFKKIEQFLSKVNDVGRFTIDEHPITTLSKLKLIRQEKPTIASMLLFAKEPLRMNIRVGRFKDDITIIDDRQITETLFVAVNEVMKFIKTYMMVAYEFHGELQRVEKWDYPINALREAILNAVVHRDYQDPSDIQIKIYDDKIVIASPGKLYGDLTLEKLKNRNYQSSLRNKLIAEAFYLTGNIEKYGSGFIRIDNELKNYPQNSYEFKEIANAMQITFYKKEPDEGTSEGINEGINSLYAYIRNNPSKRVSQIEEELKVPTKTLERWIRQLKKENKIDFQGSKKTGGYYAK